MDSKFSDLPTISKELAPVFDELGTGEPPSIEKIIPVKNTEQKAVAGTSGNKSENIVGYIGYSEYYNSLVYVVRKKQKNIIRKVDGEGFAISKSIITELKNKGVEYIFGGLNTKQSIIILPINKFCNEFHVDGWDKQLYATLANDVEHEVHDVDISIFTNYPYKSDNSITMKQAKQKIN